MKKIFTLSVIISISLFNLLPAFGQQEKTISGNSNDRYYTCEDDLIEVMFIENSRVRLRNSEPVDLLSDATAGLQDLLNGLEWHTWSRISSISEEEMDRWAINGELNTGIPVYNLNNIYRLRIPDEYNIWEISRQLEDLPGIYRAMPVPKPVPLPSYPPPPGSFQSQQGYLNSASSTPTGIDALYAWTQTGGTGTGVTVCDLEYSWNYNHADISKASGSQINPNPISDPFSNDNHGTAVIGELVSDINSYGTTGICYGSGLMTCGTYYWENGSYGWNPAGAIGYAINNLSAGDIILLEQQWEYTPGTGNYIPLEWYGSTSNGTYPNQYNNPVYVAITNAIANGIHVVEAGGNGNVNTDNLTWYGNSGAIIVGAGGAYTGGTYMEGDLQRLSFSSYGQRFDLQGWGENVVTTGYGDLYSSDGVNYYYTNTFSGTSSASPIVAGAVACAQGYYLANISSTPFSPSAMRSHLATYGTAQVIPPSGNIGPRPDLYNAIINFPPPTTDYDWGDTPDGPYPTLASSGGPSHLMDGVTFLGYSVDAEQDGQPNSNATGDDNDGNNDDDGVVFTSPLIPGQTATVQVTVSVAGFLNAWIDFNQLNIWGDVEDFIFQNVYLTQGVNNLNFSVPPIAVPGNTFARFRFNSTGGLLFNDQYGPAQDGEVEDYQVNITEEGTSAKWEQLPDLSPTGMDVDATRNPDNPPPLLLADDFLCNQTGNITDIHIWGSWINDQFPYFESPDAVQFTFSIHADIPASESPTGYSMPGDILWMIVWQPTFDDIEWINSGPEDWYNPLLPMWLNDNHNYCIKYNCILDPADYFLQEGTELNPIIYWLDVQATSLDPDPNCRFGWKTSIDHWNDDAVWVEAEESYAGTQWQELIYPDGHEFQGQSVDLAFQITTEGGGPTEQYDFGDAPEGSGAIAYPSLGVVGSFPTCINVGPAGSYVQHGFGENWAWFGPLVDIESDGNAGLCPGCFPTYDDDECFGDGDAGLIVPGSYTIDPTGSVIPCPTAAVSSLGIICQTATWGANIDIYVTNNMPVDGFVNVLIDWNQNGKWQNDPNSMCAGVVTPEHVLVNFVVPAGFIGPLSSLMIPPFTFQIGPNNGYVWTRFSISESQVGNDWDGSGVFEDGESEDYLLFVEEEEPEYIDFGDANDPTYPTLLVNDGARHIIAGGVYLGVSVDAEPDGQPDGTATGDDNDGNNDDDGVIFNQILAGSPAQITVTTSVAGFLQGWMDFNADGDWADPGEQIFTDEFIHFGHTLCLNYLVPVNANLGITYARFRFSTVAGLIYSGLAPDGEVEDYQVEISENPDIKWLQEPCTELPGLHAHDYILPPYDYIIIADDWLCNGGLVTDFHWWGNYEAPGSGINHFHLSLHANDPANCLPLDPEIIGFDVSLANANENSTGLFNNLGDLIYEYSFYPDEPFVQEEGMTYWLDICAYSNDPTDPAIWRWQESDRSNFPILCPAAEMTTSYSWQSIVWTSISPYRFSDMAFAITSEEMEQMDFGDAPDPAYPTFLANDGARHIIDGVTFMGSSIDQEYNGQPDPNALGDDNIGVDDEDGVTFTTTFVRGQNTSVDIVVSVDGYLNAWVDFNANGSWTDAGEQIASDVLLSTGTNSLLFNVPSTAMVGITYARFRFNTAGGLTFTGLANDGEVEDYEVNIEEVPNKWAQYPDPNLPGLHAHDWDYGSYQVIVLADDWICEGGWVTDIHWWGNYEMAGGAEQRGAGIDHFHLSIHLTDQSGCLPLEPEIWGVNVPFISITEQPTGLINLEGSPIYLYEYYLENPFPQTAGVHYWLDITAVNSDPTDPAIWRWQESSRMNPPRVCAAAYKSLPSPGTWTEISWANETYSDMAFVITSEEAPILDLGDANDPTYPTLLINNGAAHIYDPTVYMGSLIDTEPDGQPTADAKGDDNNGVPDDEDGINVLNPFTPGGTPWIDIVASTTGVLNAWIDYDGNGSWAETGEHFIVDQALVAGNNWIFPLVPANTNIGNTYARFRFSTVGGLSFTGIAPDGEVEDHEIMIEGDLDFGDAPDITFPAYPTLMSNDGARHLINPAIYLGNSIDAEPDGLQDPNALGDDNNAIDDEDGVILPSILGHGQMTTITVIASTGGYLNGWIDFNSSGNWTEADEHIFADQLIHTGNNTLNIYVPPTSVIGSTYARFRFSTTTGLSYIGQAPDGEVEDYEVEIGKPEKWIQLPDLSFEGMDVDATLNLGSPYPPMILADDFECTVTGPLTRIEIWGSWFNDYKPFSGDPGAVIFTLSIHEDIPADQSPTGYSMPGEVLWFRNYNQMEFMFEPYAIGLIEGWYNPAIGLYVLPGDTECWKYIFFLQEGEFVQEGTMDEPVVYWLDVQAEPLDEFPECRFGWKTSINHWNDDAVWTIGEEPYFGQWNELIYPPGHPLMGQSVDFAFAIYGDESPFILLDLKALLEGPFNGSDMNTSLNIANLIPLNQPYSSVIGTKWYYTGTESVPVIPNNDVVDWVMIELRDASSPGGAIGTTMVDEKAAFILKDGSIVATDGMSMLKSYATFTNDPYIIIWHTKHLGVLSNYPLNPVGLGVYSYDFTSGSDQAYLNGQKDLGGGVYGMMGGDGYPDEFIDNLDKNLWTTQAGTAGLKASDYDMNTQVDNTDKNDVWVPNVGKGTKVPD
ncbi:MAG: S8 family serine peptidase [Bacteroidales bacterium]|nr:S8 family serine peptidase [Bacteroidales bacterium]